MTSPVDGRLTGLTRTHTGWLIADVTERLAVIGRIDLRVIAEDGVVGANAVSIEIQNAKT